MTFEVSTAMLPSRYLHYASARRDRGIRLLVCAAMLSAVIMGGSAAHAQQTAVESEWSAGGAADEASALTGAVRVVRGPNGLFYVLEPPATRVTIIEPGGQHGGRIGSPGDGPGEFRRPASIGWHGDTLWVADDLLNRISLFTAGGKPVRELRLPALKDPLLSAQGDYQYLADGSLLVTAFPQRGAAQSQKGVVLRIASGGSRLDTVAAFDPRRATYTVPIRVMGNAGWKSGQQPVSDVPLVAASPNGRQYVVVRRDAAPSRAPATVQVTLFRSDGGRLWSRAVLYQPRATTQVVRDSVIQPVMRRTRSVTV